MNKKQLVNLGINKETADVAVECIKKAVSSGFWKGRTVRRVITDIVYEPSKFIADEHFADFAQSLIESKKDQVYVPREPLPFSVWGREHIDQNAIEQMKTAMQLPIAVAGAVMPDAHLGYGLPIGGVLATEGAIVPYAIGVDIACRIKISITDIPVEDSLIKLHSAKMKSALQDGTLFGMGGAWTPRFEHEVMDKNWNITPITKQMKDRAWGQLGTSGSGNHFVEWGILTIENGSALGLLAGEYVALMSHSGSRGVGAQVCKTYNDIAVPRLEKKYQEYFKNLAWLSMDSEAGCEYWEAMNLMGEYASANHECIHNNVIKQCMKAEVIASVENHHNFAWIEKHKGKDVYVHRKGATPAGKGVYGIIPGSMADSCYVVRGLGSEESLNSSSHGAGRVMSRKQALREMSWDHWKGVLRQRGVYLISGGLDEVPGVYKSIQKIMASQIDLVEIVAEFQPKIVKMADDGKAED